jgi:hypothetical protein
MISYKASKGKDNIPYNTIKFIKGSNNRYTKGRKIDPYDRKYDGVNKYVILEGSSADEKENDSDREFIDDDDIDSDYNSNSDYDSKSVSSSDSSNYKSCRSSFSSRTQTESDTESDTEIVQNSKRTRYN